MATDNTKERKKQIQSHSGVATDVIIGPDTMKSLWEDKVLEGDL